MKYFSMFSGIAGFELGIEKAHWFQETRALAETTNNPHPVIL
jgi:site-specific DNA-cytosine methylase